MLKFYNIVAEDDINNTLLHKASQLGYVEIIKILIDLGANINIEEYI